MKEKLQTRQILTRNMSKLLQKIVSMLLVIALMAGSLYVVPVTSVRAANPQLTRESLVMVKGHGYNLKLSGASGKVTWKTSNSAVVSFEKVSDTHIKLTAKGTGSAAVSAKVGSKTYKCSVKVINAKLNETKLSFQFNKQMSTGHMFKVSGAKVKKWVIKDTSILKFDGKKEGTFEYYGQKPTVSCTKKKSGTTKVLAYVEDSILTCTVTVKKIADEKEKELSEKEKKGVLTYAGQHTTFDGLHIGEGHTYENYIKNGKYGGKGFDSRDLTVPVYNGKLVDVRDEKMLQKALRADKVIGKFYREYIRTDMDDMERLQAVFNFLNTRKSVLITSTSKAKNPYTTDSITTKCGNGCGTCQKYMSSYILGIPKGTAYMFPYANSAYVALYSNTATYAGWAEAFEFLCVAAGLKAFMRNYYQLSEPPVVVNLGGYWVEVNVARYGYGKKGKYFNFSNGGDIDADGEIDVSENIRVGTSASQCQYVHLKSWNRYSSAMPKCYGHEYEYPDTRDVRLYNLDSKYEWKEFIEVNSKFYEPLVEFKNNWVLYSCRY